ncbi:polysaccharide deacetylase family protein [Cohnella lubricantis]|uniref:polysaccharide deacetylase family protein n=1 Tax=Cohnella lubricantis TaxID=2163172 RepID=UPI001FD8F26D|nr:polysaccharide deacetylase family protein [Cohnella lubricantis]
MEVYLGNAGDAAGYRSEATKRGPQAEEAERGYRLADVERRGRKLPKLKLTPKPKPTRNKALNYRWKNRIKSIRAVIQLALIAGVVYLLVNASTNLQHYVEPDRSQWTSGQGFIALSYFGVSRSGSSGLISQSELDAQLKALKNQGYVTISQQDVLDYYTKGKKLPAKALFLAFEDGRNDSGLFAESALKKYNFKATMLTYADKMGHGQRKFLQPGDLKKMMDSGYWELGSNGYRLSYINVIGSEGAFLGAKDESELRDKSKIAQYNHYLMDFIRDSDMIPVENRQQMEARINADYEKMKEVYSDKFGFVPSVYMIMHANALNRSMNPLVSQANEANIEKLFRLHFSREGDAFNGPSANVYDLTRLQPQPYWQTNHLLMKIKKDTGQPIQFVAGDEKRASQWELVRGAAEFSGSRIALTSEPGGTGMLVLKDSERYADIELSAALSGNVVGRQSLYVRYDRESGSYLRITLDNNEVIVEQKKPGQAAKRLLAKELGEVEGPTSGLKLNKAAVYSGAQLAQADQAEQSKYPLQLRNTRQLSMAVVGDKLSVRVDGTELLADQAIDGQIASGFVALESAYHEQGDNDDIYDGVFDNLEVREASDDAGEAGSVLYSNRLSGVRRIADTASHVFNTTVDWVMDTF